MGHNIEYRFNQWRLSGEHTGAYNPLVADMLRQHVGLVSGAYIAEILYRNKIEGVPIRKLKLKSASESYLAKSIIEGNGFVANKYYFERVLEEFPEQLDRLFKLEKEVTV